MRRRPPPFYIAAMRASNIEGNGLMLMAYGYLVITAAGKDNRQSVTSLLRIRVPGHHLLHPCFVSGCLDTISSIPASYQGAWTPSPPSLLRIRLPGDHLLYPCFVSEQDNVLTIFVFAGNISSWPWRYWVSYYKLKALNNETTVCKTS